MKYRRQFLSVLFAVLLLASFFSCAKNAPVVSPTPTQSSGLDAPVFTLEPVGIPETAVPDPTPDPVKTPSETDSPEPAETPVPTDAPTPEPTDTPCPVSEDGEYWTRDEVALYIHLFRHLPKNYISKEEAEDLGWSGGSLEPYAPGYSIGGDYFGNYQGLLPKKKGRKYYECDIDTRGKKSRGAKRIVFSNDGLIYYTGDHYESFTLLYGEE
ncbi:MAG: ribonuclease [Clostridia bacterium]|nr:ribonuclease [Clostridia bacterium]